MSNYVEGTPPKYGDIKRSRNGLIAEIYDGQEWIINPTLIEPVRQVGVDWARRYDGPRNGMGTASMVLGLFALFLFCVPVGLIGLLFGLIGRNRAAHGQATNMTTAWAGLWLNGIALTIQVVGLTLFFMAAQT